MCAFFLLVSISQNDFILEMCLYSVGLISFYASEPSHGIISFVGSVLILPDDLHSHILDSLRGFDFILALFVILDLDFIPYLCTLP